MARIKSLLTRIDVDLAQRTHSCQASKEHRIQRGEKRLKVRNERSWDHYCLECARMIVERDTVSLQKLAGKLKT